MKKSVSVVLAMMVLALAACNEAPKDSVPKVDDPSHPVDENGNAMSPNDFIKKYCLLKNQGNATCELVKKAARLNSAYGTMPKGY